MGSQRVGHDWSTELNWTEIKNDQLNHWCYGFCGILVLTRGYMGHHYPFLSSDVIFWSFYIMRSWALQNLPARQETRVWFLDQEDPLGKGMVTHSSILTWRIPWTEEPGGLQSMTEWLNTMFKELVSLSSLDPKLSTFRKKREHSNRSELV